MLLGNLFFVISLGAVERSPSQVMAEFSRQLDIECSSCGKKPGQTLDGRSNSIGLPPIPWGSNKRTVEKR